MTAVVKTLMPSRPMGKDQLLSFNIPFLDRNNPDAFQEDFKPFFPKKTESVQQSAPAQVDHKDLGHIEEYQTEAMGSYQRHPLQQITRTPRWITLNTNFKMQTDPAEVSFLSTQSQTLRPHPFQPPPAPIRQVDGSRRGKIQQVGEIPTSTNRASFIPHPGAPVVKATVKHLEEGFPTIKGDRRHHSYVSQYNSSFQGTWSRPAQPVKKHSSVIMGDPVKVVERETSHAASFSWPALCRQPAVKERLKLSLAHFSKDSSTRLQPKAPLVTHAREKKQVVPTRKNKNFSSLPKGDTDMRRNKERMSVTTNRISFSHLKQTERPAHVHGSDLMTKSNVQFSPPHLSSLYYTTTTREHYSKQDGERARPVIRLPNNILTGPEHGASLSTTKTDYLPLKLTHREAPSTSKHMSNIRFPVADQHFSTTHSEVYTAKPLVLQRPGCSQFLSHFVIQ